MRGKNGKKINVLILIWLNLILFTEEERMEKGTAPPQIKRKRPSLKYATSPTLFDVELWKNCVTFDSHYINFLNKLFFNKKEYFIYKKDNLLKPYLYTDTTITRDFQPGGEQEDYFLPRSGQGPHFTPTVEINP